MPLYNTVVCYLVRSSFPFYGLRVGRQNQEWVENIVILTAYMFPLWKPQRQTFVEVIGTSGRPRPISCLYNGDHSVKFPHSWKRNLTFLLLFGLFWKGGRGSWVSQKYCWACLGHSYLGQELCLRFQS